jgi:hypothetical protein
VTGVHSQVLDAFPPLARTLPNFLDLLVDFLKVDWHRIP